MAATTTRRKDRTPCFVAVQTLALLLVSCAGSDPSDSRPAESASGFGEGGVVRIGYANEAPFAYYDHATGKLTGESVEVTRHILKEAGISRVEGVITEFASLIPGLKARRFDIIAAGMYIHPRRLRADQFLGTDFVCRSRFHGRSGQPSRSPQLRGRGPPPDGPAWCHRRRRGTRLCTGGRYSRRETLHLPRRAKLDRGLTSRPGGRCRRDRADAQGISWPRPTTPASKSRSRSSKPIVEGRPAGLCSALGFRKEDAAFLRKFNRSLEAFIGSERHLAIVRPFGFGEQNMPGGHTTEQLCRPLLP